MKFDVSRVQALLSVVKSVTEVAPGFNYLIGEAMAELRQINENVRKANEVAKGLPVTPAQYGDKNSPSQNNDPSGSGVAKPTASAPLDDQTPDDAPPEILKEPEATSVQSAPTIKEPQTGYVPGVDEARKDAGQPRAIPSSSPSLLDRRL